MLTAQALNRVTYGCVRAGSPPKQAGAEGNVQIVKPRTEASIVAAVL